jgi:hypothetical protein
MARSGGHDLHHRNAAASVVTGLAGSEHRFLKFALDFARSQVREEEAVRRVVAVMFGDRWRTDTLTAWRRSLKTGFV